MVRIDVTDDRNILIDGSKKDYLIILKNDEVNIVYAISESCRIIVIAERPQITLNDSGYIGADLNVDITYINLEKGRYVQESNIDVRQGSKLNVTSKYLCNDNKAVNMNYINKERYSEINIDNSCVCMDKSNMELNCTGKIVKGAKASKSHQSSRCLTIDNPEKSLIRPILLIDEDDVEASHSLSSGTIDQDIMFYLYSRGISYKEAMILFINSYLLPQEYILDGFDNAEEITAYLNEKVVNIYA